MAIAFNEWAGRIIFTLCVIVIFNFYSVQKLWADELSELKTQLKVMQQQIQEQARQMDVMQEKIEKLEAQRQARIETPKEMQDRVTALEGKLKEKGNVNVSWKDGIYFQTEDKQFDMKIGGRLHMDMGWFDEESKVRNRVGNIEDDGEIRRARFYIKGTLYENLIYKLEYDWATGTAQLKDAFIGLKNIPYLGTIKAGHFFEQFSLENRISTNNMTFIEFALPKAFAPIRNVGIAANSTAFDERMTWATGIFRDADNQGNITGNEWNWTNRLTFLPCYEDKGEKLLHLGVSYSLRTPEETLSYSSRPEAHLAPTFVNTGTIYADRANLVVGEAAVVHGPLSLQGEYMGSIVDQTNPSTDLYFQGGYAYASYFLTGEHRPYSKSTGVFSRLRPHKNFSLKDKGLGAWELKVRYSWLDLNDENIDGGVMSDVSAGINWYLNPNMRIMGDYIHSHLNGTGDADMVLTRFQVDF